MAITLGGLTLPNGLRWTNEFAWTPKKINAEYSLTGALIIQTGSYQAGRLIVLEGGINFAWITRANLLTLKNALENCADTGIALTLHDARAFTVLPYGDTPLITNQVPKVSDKGLADPSTNTKYYIETINLIIL